jgi:hypothetical protein
MHWSLAKYPTSHFRALNTLLAMVAEKTPGASFLMNTIQRSQIEYYIACGEVEFPVYAKKLTAWLDEKVPRIERDPKKCLKTESILPIKSLPSDILLTTSKYDSKFPKV